MFELKKSIIVSNILDPLSKNPKDLEEAYLRLIKSNKYEAIETRPILNQELIRIFNDIRPTYISTTYYVTGDLSRANLSLSSGDEENRNQAVEVCKRILIEGSKTSCTYLGIGSGAIETNALQNLEQFVKSLSTIFDFIQKEKLSIKLAIEPLDQYAHKKNVIGSLDMVIRLIKKLEKKGYDQNNWVLTWDAAHVALNEDDFEESIQKLAKYIYKIHFANAILDKNNKLYGDNHIGFEQGFMNLEVATNILSYCKKYIDHPIEVACEIREKDRNHCWVLEEETYEFLNKAFLPYK